MTSSRQSSEKKERVQSMSNVLTFSQDPICLLTSKITFILLQFVIRRFVFQHHTCSTTTQEKNITRTNCLTSCEVDHSFSALTVKS